jgi:hypothetical protein
MSSKHTPGPWRRGSDELSSPELFSEVYGPNEFVIATCHVGNARGKDRREAVDYVRANARLIAAAPELLRACEAVSAHYSGSLDHQPPFVALCRAALARATGEQQ